MKTTAAAMKMWATCISFGIIRQNCWAFEAGLSTVHWMVGDFTTTIEKFSTLPFRSLRQINTVKPASRPNNQLYRVYLA